MNMCVCVHFSSHSVKSHQLNRMLVSLSFVVQWNAHSHTHTYTHVMTKNFKHCIQIISGEGEWGRGKGFTLLFSSFLCFCHQVGKTFTICSFEMINLCTFQLFLFILVVLLYVMSFINISELHTKHTKCVYTLCVPLLFEFCSQL